MKQDEHIRNYQSTVEGDAVKMSIDESATAHIMDVLTKLYADPELAIIREYSTNALDSHIEAGVTRPIEVTLPTTLAPFLTIRDYGIGLDADGIRDIYSRYGTSTKRGSNDAVGMLGLGCKSALSYTDQFTLTGFKDGFRTEVLISRDEDGAGSMTIVDEGLDESHLGNGVKVTIPAKRDNAIASKANDFFRFWTPGSVLVNGKQPQHIGDPTRNNKDNVAVESIWLDDRTLLTTEVDESLVVMGNVPYPLVEGDDPLFFPHGSGRVLSYRERRAQTWNAVCFVDIGDVNFAPSRESLMTTKRTKAKLTELRAKIAALRDESIRKQIAAAPNAKEAQDLLRKGQSLGFKDAATWQGREVVLTLQREQPAGTGSDFANYDVETALKYSYLYVNSNSYMRKNGERARTIDLSQPATIFVGFDGKAMTNVKRAKLEKYCADNGIEYARNKRMIFMHKLRPDEKFWLSGWPIYNWAEVDAVVLPKTVQADGTTTRLKGSYDIINAGNRESGVPAATIAALAKSKPLLWVNGNTWNAGTHRALRSEAVRAADNIIVCLPANRVDKFCRDFPAAIKLEDAARQAAERWVKSQDQDTIAASQVKIALRDYRCLGELDKDRVRDPELSEALRLFHKSTTSYDAEARRFTYWNTVNPSPSPKVRAAGQALAKYPLLASFGGYSKHNREHLYIYIDAAYKAEKGDI